MYFRNKYIIKIEEIKLINMLDTVTIEHIDKNAYECNNININNLKNNTIKIRIEIILKFFNTT
ncbi:hypothetical protein RJU59_01040 [Buchnera aphidicola (Kurisakia onigurumii)]